MPTSKLPNFVDFEASSLGPRSYPIEVGWSLDDGTVESHLIDPASQPAWTDWDPGAEHEIHGISRELIIKEGRDPLWVAARMNETLGGRLVYTDAPDWDGFWLQVLFDAAGLVPAFRLGTAQALWYHKLDKGRDFDLRERFAELEHLASARISGPRHRAANDVRYFIELYRLCCTAG